MNKPKTIDTYYCDYSGNECVLPVMEDEKYYAECRGIKLYEFTKGEKIVIKQELARLIVLKS